MFCNFEVLQNKDITENINKIEVILNVKSNSNSKYENITPEPEQFETAFEMFTFLNICPTWNKHMLKDIFETVFSVKELLLALNNIKKLASNSDKILFGKVWSLLMESLNLNYHDKINSFLPNTEFSKNYNKEDNSINLRLLGKQALEKHLI